MLLTTTTRLFASRTRSKLSDTQPHELMRTMVVMLLALLAMTPAALAQLDVQRPTEIIHVPDVLIPDLDHAPEHVEKCYRDSAAIGCAIVQWSPFEVAIEAAYHARVQQARLIGPGGTLTFEPTVYCDVSGPGPRRGGGGDTYQCMAERHHDRDLLKWYIGGRVTSPIDETLDGVYSGHVDLEVWTMEADTHPYRVLVPVNYTVTEAALNCTMFAGGGFSVSGLPAGVSGSITVHAATGDASYSGQLHNEVVLLGDYGISPSLGSVSVVLSASNLPNAILQIEADNFLTGPGGKTLGWTPTVGYIDDNDVAHQSSVGNSFSTLPLSSAYINGRAAFTTGGTIYTSANTLPGEYYSGQYRVQMYCN